MVIEYDIETGRIQGANYGLDFLWDAAKIAHEESKNPNSRWVIIENEENIFGKYYEEATQEILPLQSLPITRNFLPDQAIRGDGIQKAIFQNIPENAKITIDDNSPITMDSSGVLEFSATDPGLYRLYVKARGYEWEQFTVLVDPD